MMEAEPVLTQVCLIHRYDEWVKADRIIWPVEKGTKKRQRKKVKVSVRVTGVWGAGLAPPPVMMLRKVSHSGVK